MGIKNPGASLASNLTFYAVISPGYATANSSYDRGTVKFRSFECYPGIFQQKVDASHYVDHASSVCLEV